MSYPVIIGAVILVSALYGILLYNRFIKKQNLCKEGWSGINVQLKRRYDLIPNLVASVKGYAGHEKETLEKLVELRSSAMQAQTPQEKSKAEIGISGTLKTLFALMENYPDLKANENFIQLQSSLVDIEDNLQNARRYYNATVRDYNTMVDAFPSNIIARSYGFEKKEYFEIDEAEKQNVKVAF